MKMLPFCFLAVVSLAATATADTDQQIDTLVADVAVLKRDLGAAKVEIGETKKILQSLKLDFGRTFSKELSNRPECTAINLEWTKLANGKKYHFSTERLNWKQAKEFCKRSSMHLASPKTQQELTLLYQRAKALYEKNNNWWVSASDVGGKAGEFKWHDGQILPKNSTLWNKELDRPGDYGAGKETCVHFASYYKDKLMDSVCFPAGHFICELPVYC
ncbi:lectin-like [Cloeon dipterum]|uniref:lectin-like n=1 Tax=Cloeon dipterum TaxID=197152 RepID=UPI00322094C9